MRPDFLCGVGDCCQLICAYPNQSPMHHESNTALGLVVDMSMIDMCVISAL